MSTDLNLEDFCRAMCEARLGELEALATWLDERAAECLKTAKSRRESAGNRNATEAELKTDKAMAEKMFGRKLDLVSTKPEDNARNHDMQLRIAAKDEAEAERLSAWAVALRTKPSILVRETVMVTREEAAREAGGWTGEINTFKNAAVVSEVCRLIARKIRSLSLSAENVKKEK